MGKSIFISHATKNAWLVKGLLELMRAVDPEAEIFCSFEPVLKPGENYREEIYKKLNEADIFVAVISTDYWKSKFSIFELGAAYERYSLDKMGAVLIQPLLVPPLDKGMALAGTPMVEMQLTDLTDSGSIALFLNKITDYQKKSVVDKLNVRIAEYAAFVMSSVLSMTSLTEGAEVGAYYDEPANNGIPRERIVRGTVLGEERFLFEYRLSSLGYDPSFCSLVFKQWDEIDFKKYLSFDANAAFCFTIDNSKNSVNAVNVEFKYGSNRVLYKSVRMPLSEGVNELSIPLAPMNHKPLSEVSEISFVFWKQDRNDPDGEVILEGIKVRFAADTNIFIDD